VLGQRSYQLRLGHSLIRHKSPLILPLFPSETIFDRYVFSNPV
jgi:hypothetical protein